MSTGSRRKQKDTSNREVRAPEQQAGTLPEDFKVVFSRLPSGGWAAVAHDGSPGRGESLLAAFADVVQVLARQKQPTLNRVCLLCGDTFSGPVLPILPHCPRCAEDCSDCPKEAKASASGPVDELRNAGVL